MGTDPEFVAALLTEVESACKDFDASNDDAVTVGGQRYVLRLRVRVDALVSYARANGVPVDDLLAMYDIGAAPEVRSGC